MSRLTYDKDRFYLDGEPFQIRSGSIHYFRHVPEYWLDRLKKLRAAGFNTVETYTCWNLHERKEGEFDFSGMLDLAKFLDLAAELGLYAIVRPGPYICAEWDFGGLPSWLLTYPNMRVRCMDPLFLEKEKRYLDQIFAILRPRQITQGGNILMVQVENEYGSFGNDHVYLAHLAEYYRACGIDTLLFTSDGAGDWMLGGGTIPGTLAAANFGRRWQEEFGVLKEFRPEQPCMCAEFWEGWFDSWYQPHHRREPDDVAELYDGMLGAGHNVNFYMFTGGTNFGFHNGANDYEKYYPQTTSYDYDAMLTEAGDLAPRFFAIRAVNEKYAGKLPPIDVDNSKKAAYGEIALTQSVRLADALDQISAPVHCAYPMTMEELGADFGFVLYETVVDYAVEDRPLEIEPLRDRVHIFIDGKFAGIKERDRRNDEVRVTVQPGSSVKISLLVENLGRVNYGVTMSDNRKGLPGGARLGQQYLFGWTMYPLTMDDLSGLRFVDGAQADCPVFLRGELEISGEPADTFIRLPGFTKGFVVVNGFNLGRYWNPAGPQKTLYLPAPILREGQNEIIVFESDGYETPTILSEALPDIG